MATSCGAIGYQSFEERKRWLPLDLAIYNNNRKHSAHGWRSPQQRLAKLLH